MWKGLINTFIKPVMDSTVMSQKLVEFVLFWKDHLTQECRGRLKENGEIGLGSMEQVGN